MLTAVSTVLGMIPIAPTVFWGPMAFAIMGGLLVATILTLVFLPTLYVAWFGWRDARSAKLDCCAGMLAVMENVPTWSCPTCAAVSRERVCKACIGRFFRSAIWQPSDSSLLADPYRSQSPRSASRNVGGGHCGLGQLATVARAAES